MVHPENWLFQIPDGDSLDEQRAIVESRLNTDPGAQSISDEEAENFMSAAMCLVFAPPDGFSTFARAFGMPGQSRNKAFRRQVILLMLRSWRNPRTQELLQVIRSGMCFDDLAAGNEGPTRITLAALESAYYKGQNVIWLSNLLRQTGRADQIPTLLGRLEEAARRIYTVHLDVGRLMLRRIVDGVDTHKGQADHSPQQIHAQLKQKTLSAAQAKREMVDQRRLLTRQERLRQAKELSVDIYLDGVRQEVAAAEGRLAATVTRQAEAERTLHERHRLRLVELEAETAAVEVDFARALTTRTTAWPLAGLRVAITGEWGEAERLLIESVGGRLVPHPVDRPDLLLQLGQSGADQPVEGIFFTADKGPPALERLLHRRVLPQFSRFRPS